MGKHDKDPLTVIKQEAGRATSRRMIATEVKLVDNHLKKKDFDGLVAFFSSKQYEPLSDKQKSYICLYILYALTYQITGNEVIHSVESIGIPESHSRTQKELVLLIAGVHEQKLDAALLKILISNGVPRRVLERLAQEFSRHFKKGANTGAGFTPHRIAQVYNLDEENPLFEMSFFTLTALGAFSTHVTNFTEMTDELLKRGDITKEEAPGVLELSLLNSLREIAKHAQIIELPLIREGSGGLISFGEGNRKVLTWKSLIDGSTYTKELRVWESYTKENPDCAILAEQVGCPMIYHPMFNELLKAHVRHYKKRLQEKRSTSALGH